MAAVLAGVAAAAGGAAGGAREVKLPCLADTNVSAYPEERPFNYGRSPHLRLKGIEMLMLARFDTAPVRGWKVEKASLFLHAGGKHQLRTLGVSTVAVDWAEGEGTGNAAPTGATFLRADAARPWGGPQSDLTDATFTRQGTRAAYADLVPRADGWLEVEVPGWLVEAMASGASYGMAISDEKGQTRFNNEVHSREQSGFAPYLVVSGRPGAPTEITRTITRTRTTAPRPAPLGGVEAVTWGSGEPPVHDGLRAWAYGECEKAHPVTGNLLEETGAAQIAKAASGSYRRRNSVWDGAASTIHLRGARNEFVGFHLCLEAVKGAVASARLTPADLLGPGGLNLGPQWVRLEQDWYVRDGEPYPEVAVPLAVPLSIPDPRAKIAGQRNFSLFAEVYIPPQATPGPYNTRLEISAEGVKPFSLPVELQVYGFALPDTLSFDVDLNAYGPPGDAERELRFHRMAHEHRTTLNILGYSQRGVPDPAYVPPLEGSGKSLRVKDWTEWDRRFGGYFDGSAFADLPRSRVPLRHAYLPFCEGWPSDLRQHYRYTPTITAYPDLIVEHALKAPPVESAFDQQFQDEFQAVVREFARHFREKGWSATDFQFYLNDKYYYKDPKQGGRGSSWWLLDEPMHRDDWLALRFFGKLFKDGVREALPTPSPRDPKLVFRADVSRPQWQRDWLDGLVDLMCVSSEFFAKNELCRQIQREQHVTFWHYGTGNEIRETNLTEEAWAVKAYLAGADGILPWNSLGGDESFDRPSPTTILYPGERFGVQGPLASLRLKAFRRGQQDVEYLALLAKKRGWSREQLAAAVAPLVSLKGATRERFVDDAGTPAFDNLTSEQFARLRASVAAELAR